MWGRAPAQVGIFCAYLGYSPAGAGFRLVPARVLFGVFECGASDCSRVEKRLPDDAHDARVLAPRSPNDARLLAWIGIQEAPNDVPDVRLLAPSGTHDIPNDAYDHDSASGNGGH